MQSQVKGNSEASGFVIEPVVIDVPVSWKDLNRVVAYAKPRVARDDSYDDHHRTTFHFSPPLTAANLIQTEIQGRASAKLIPKSRAVHSDDTHNEQVLLTLFAVWRRLKHLGFMHFTAEDSSNGLLSQLVDIYEAIDITLTLGEAHNYSFTPISPPEFLQLKSTVAGGYPLSRKTWCFKLLSLIPMDNFQEEPSITFHFFDKSGRSLDLGAVPACALDDVFGVSGFVYGRYHEPVKPSNPEDSVTAQKRKWEYLHNFRFDDVVETMPIGRAIAGSASYRLCGDLFLSQACSQALLSNEKGNQMVLDISNDMVRELSLSTTEDEETFYEALRTDLHVSSDNIVNFFRRRIHSVLDFFKPEALDRDYLNTFRR